MIAVVNWMLFQVFQKLHQLRLVVVDLISERTSWSSVNSHVLVAFELQKEIDLLRLKMKRTSGGDREVGQCLTQSPFVPSSIR